MGETEIGILDCISQFLYNSTEVKETELYGYSRPIKVTGVRDGRKVRRILYHTHPASPIAIATELIANSAVKTTGVITKPEEAFDPAVIFAE